jgi:uncharacterized repeat protein (TIGR01451 family)
MAELPPAGGDYLMAKIPIRGSATEFYTVEARRFLGYDAQVPGEAIVIHRVNTTLDDRLAQVVDPDGNGDPNDAGAMWRPGETFTDAANGITVAVLSSGPTGFEVSISTGSGGAAGKPDLSVRIQAPARANLGDNLAYTIVVQNDGAGPATSVRLSDTLPGRLAFDATQSDARCAAAGKLISCSLGDLEPGASTTVNIVATASKAGRAVNAARVAAREVDGNASNNRATAVTTVARPPRSRS